MIELEIPRIDFHFYNERGVRVKADYDPEFEALQEEPKEMWQTNQSILEELGVKKPEWFVRSEASARLFLGSLGLEEVGEVYLLEEGERLDEIGLREPKSTVGIVDNFLGHTMMRMVKAEEWQDRFGEVAVTSALVHEFMHGATPKTSSAYCRKNSEGDIDFSFRSGFDVATPKGDRGLFNEEGMAEFMGGWYRRCAVDPLASVVSIVDFPSPDLPAHYQRIDRTGKVDTSMVEGPDGYAMELLAWGLDRRGIMTREAFVITMLETRRPDTQLAALRSFAENVNVLRPGLYRDLRDLEYSKENWREGCRQVYDVVTADRGKL